jgi:hypothetical protein
MTKLVIIIKQSHLAAEESLLTVKRLNLTAKLRLTRLATMF